MIPQPETVLPVRVPTSTLVVGPDPPPCSSPSPSLCGLSHERAGPQAGSSRKGFWMHSSSDTTASFLAEVRTTSAIMGGGQSTWKEHCRVPWALPASDTASLAWQLRRGFA